MHAASFHRGRDRFEKKETEARETILLLRDIISRLEKASLSQFSLGQQQCRWKLRLSVSYKYRGEERGREIVREIVPREGESRRIFRLQLVLCHYLSGRTRVWCLVPRVIAAEKSTRSRLSNFDRLIHGRRSPPYLRAAIRPRFRILGLRLINNRRNSGEREDARRGIRE